MKPLSIVQVVGARPQFIKLAPVSRALRARGQVTELIVHTGQHYDPQLSEVFFRELSIPHPAVNLEVGSGTHGQQTAAMLASLERYLQDQRPQAVIVYGDTNSTLAGVLAAAKLHIPVAHVEAGLRSFNRAMPEELNRVATDHLADLLLAPTAAAVNNLVKEGLEERTRLSGDVMYDALLANAALAHEESRALERLSLGATPFGIVTIHRAESTTAEALAQVLPILELTSQLVPLVLPLHPRTRDAIRSVAPGWQPPATLRIVAPLGPLDMLRVTEAAAVVLTDSGGLQKEAFMLGRPCVTLRAETEWVETVSRGANVLVGHDRVAALAAVRDALARPREFQRVTAAAAAELYGLGRAAERCVSAVLELGSAA